MIKVSDIILKTTGLKKYFKVNGGVLHAVDGVDLEIPRGKTLGVVGESGCGKSTLGRLLLRLIDPTEGEIIFEGKNILDYRHREMQQIRRNMQIIFQDPNSSLNPRMSVFELIAEPLVSNKIHQNKDDLAKDVFRLMDLVGLAGRFVNSYPHEMDGGRRQRVGIARALALNPKFIVCDEPVSALDVSIQAQILNLLVDLQEEMELTYVFITHDLSVVKHISDEICVMYLGQCVERASSDVLFSNPLHPYTKALISAIPRASLVQQKTSKVIRGEVSDPVNPKPGCRFAPRCEYCVNLCGSDKAILKELSSNHFVACSNLT